MGASEGLNAAPATVYAEGGTAIQYIDYGVHQAVAVLVIAMIIKSRHGTEVRHGL